MSGDSEDFASMLAEFEKESAPKKKVRAGDVVTGTVIAIGAESVFVDLGSKSEGVLDLDQISDEEGKILVEVGDRIEARVVDAGDKSGVVVACSKKLCE